MTTSQDQTQRTELENQIKNKFSDLQKNLEDLRNDVNTEADEAKKRIMEEELEKLEEQATTLKNKIDTISSLSDEELQTLNKQDLWSLKNDIIESTQESNGEDSEQLTEKVETPTTYELLKDSVTYNKLKDIISSNPKEFANIPWDTPEIKIEYIFSQIRKWVTLFLKNKLWDSEKHDKVIENTIAPAFEWCLMEMLKEQWNETNTNMLNWLNQISWDSLNNLITWVWDFAQKTKWSFDKFSQWMNAIDYLSVHNWVLGRAENSAVLTSPVEFKNYLNNPAFADETFSPYNLIAGNIFKEDENQTFGFWISLQEKQNILDQIWNIQVVNNPKTTALITKMLDKPEKFFGASAWLQQAANSLLDWANALNSLTKTVGIDLIWEITKPPEERWFWYKIIDFVCKLIWITWWLEWIVKKWRLDRLNLTDEKNENITKIFEEYQKLAWKWNDITVTDDDSRSLVLADFTLTDLDKQSTTKWDYLRDVIAENVDINLIPVSVIQQTLWNDYLKKEIVTVNEEQQEKITVDTSKITEENKRELAHLHITNMKTHLEGDFSELKDFYSSIYNIDDLVICMTTSLYADKDDVIEWVKAKVFLPENYGVIYEWNNNVYNEWQDNWWESDEWNSGWRSNLDSTESSDKQTVSEQWMYDKIIEYWVTNDSQAAYILATAKLETNRSDQPWFKNIEEQWKWNGQPYWKIDSWTWKAYYGRWFVQLTWKDNYEKYTEILRNSGKDFKDNDGNILKGSDIDLVKDPDIILKSNDLAAFILVHWMENWIFTWKKLDDFINDTKTDFVGARQIVNWNDMAQKWADYAQSYLNTLTA